FGRWGRAIRSVAKDTIRYLRHARGIDRSRRRRSLRSGTACRRRRGRMAICRTGVPGGRPRRKDGSARSANRVVDGSPICGVLQTVSGAKGHSSQILAQTSEALFLYSVTFVKKL